MTERELREVLIHGPYGLREVHPKSRIVQEMCAGGCRVDVATIDDHGMRGIEIKSARDTLKRLDTQIAAYQRVFDYVSVLADDKHVEDLLQCLPREVGILVQRHGCLMRRRDALFNDLVEPLAVAELLWRDEALSVLARCGFEAGVKRKPRTILWERLATWLKLPDLKKHVRHMLLRRNGWLARREGWSE